MIRRFCQKIYRKIDCVNKIYFSGKKTTDVGLLILYYHGVTKKNIDVYDWCFQDYAKFEKQIYYLKENFDILPLYKAVQLLIEGKIKKTTVAITFDDGFQNNYDVAFPLLRELKIPVTIFLTTGLVDKERTIWFCELNDILTATLSKEINFYGAKYNISDNIRKANISALLQGKLKELHPDEIENNLLKIKKELSAESIKYNMNNNFKILDKNSILEMNDSGLIDFGAHTHTHVILSKLSNEKQFEEISKSISEVEKLTGKPCRVFAYPNGRKQDFNKFSTDTLLRLGVDIAVTTIPGINNKNNTNALELYRFGIGSSISMNQFKDKILKAIKGCAV